MLRATALLLGTASLLAQEPPPDAVLLLRDPSGAPVADAVGHFRLERAAELVAVRGLSLPGTQLAARDLAAASDARGLLRLPSEEALAASGLVHTPAGLGAVVARLRPREARRLVLQPMGEVTTHAGSEPFTLWARASLPTGAKVTLAPQSGTTVRLPTGSYEVWASGPDGFTWQRLDVRSGQRALLSFAGPGQRVQARPGTHMHPAGWPELDLFATSATTTLLATALASPFVTFVDGRSSGARVLPGPRSPAPLAWPPAAEAVAPLAIELGEAAALGQATLLSVRQDAAGGLEVLGVAHARAGRCLLPPPPPGDVWLLLLARDRAPRACPWSPSALPVRFDARPGLPLRVKARDEQGLPAVDVTLEYVPDGMAVAAIVAHSDGRGEARFGPVLAPGELRVSDPRFANQDLELDMVPGDGVVVTVAAGAELRGTALWPDGAVAPNVVVTVRDPAGRLRPAQRSVVSDERGRFTFPGLPGDRAMVLFATATRDGRTWSGRLDRLVPGGQEVALELRDEDPQLGPGR